MMENLLTADKMNDLRTFFAWRFGVFAEDDKEYFSDWVKRYNNGTLEKYADSKSLEILRELKLI